MPFLTLSVFFYIVDQQLCANEIGTNQDIIFPKEDEYVDVAIVILLRLFGSDMKTKYKKVMLVFERLKVVTRG